MLILRVAVCLALLVGLMTLIISFLNNARPLTILYRTIISISIFGIFSYLIGIIAEKWIAKSISQLKAADEKDDILNKNADTQNDTEFDPFIPENFENISSPRK